MLSDLIIALAHLKLGNNSQKLKDEISHLVYYYSWSKEMSEKYAKIFLRHHRKMETIFMNTKKVRLKKSHLKFKFQSHLRLNITLADKIDLKNLKKYWLSKS